VFLVGGDDEGASLGAGDAYAVSGRERLAPRLGRLVGEKRQRGDGWRSLTVGRGVALGLATNTGEISILVAASRARDGDGRTKINYFFLGFIAPPGSSWFLCPTVFVGRESEFRRA